MSKFVTSIPVDVDIVIASLPERSFVHSVTLLRPPAGGPTSIEIVWDNDALKTAYTFPLPYPLEKLLGKTVDKPAKKAKK